MRTLSSLTLVALGLALPLTLGDRPDLGEAAIELTGVDQAGADVRLADRPSKPVVLYFFSSSTRDCSEALEQLAEQLGHAEGAEGIEVLAISASTADTELVTSALGEHGTHVVSSDGADMTAYEVIAFPTALVLDGDHEVVAIVRGFGVMAGFKIAAAARLASGAIDRAGYEAILGGGHAPAVEKAQQRYVRMVRKLVLEGRTDAAVALLAGRSEERGPEEELLFLRLQLASGDAIGARATRAALPESPSLPALDIELLLLEGELEAAAAALADLDVRQAPRGRYLEALLLRARGDAEAAAALDRETVQRLMILGDSD